MRRDDKFSKKSRGELFTDVQHSYRGALPSTAVYYFLVFSCMKSYVFSGSYWDWRQMLKALLRNRLTEICTKYLSTLKWAQLSTTHIPLAVMICLTPRKRSVFQHVSLVFLVCCTLLRLVDFYFTGSTLFSWPAAYTIIYTVSDPAFVRLDFWLSFLVGIYAENVFGHRDIPFSSRTFYWLFDSLRLLTLAS